MLELHLQFVLLWLFWRWGLLNYFPWLASNRDPPYLSLPVARLTDVSHWHLAVSGEF
jgi:hypothetical protein